jgi:hypothetical protein
MTVAPGLLDRRVACYAPADGGAEGFARTVYVRTGIWWARIDTTADAENVPLSPQAHIDGRETATMTVMAHVPVPRGGIVREVQDGPRGTLYHVRGIVPLRVLRAQRVTLEAIAPDRWNEYALYDDREALDGWHLLTANGPDIPPTPPLPPRAYSDAYSAAYG